VLWNLFSKHPRVGDVLLAGAAMLFSLGEAKGHAPFGTVIAFALLASLPLLVRRRYPMLVLGVVLVVTVAAELVLHRTMQLPAALAIYSVAALRDRDVSLRACALAGIVLFVPLPGLDGWTPPIPAVAAWVLGDTLRVRRAQLRAEREESARRAATEEQARIARELHDVIAHNVSVMVVQAAAAGDVFDSQPQRARAALRAIEETGRAALTELRQLLAGVRTEFEPQPRLTVLGPLVEGLRAAGLEVEVHVEGELGNLPAGLDLSAYRIVQEALTNTLKHAHASAAEVRITRTADAVDLEVLDDGVGAMTANGDGHGLIGMRERASLVGGEVEAGPRPDGGFRVHARLPL